MLPKVRELAYFFRAIKLVANIAKKLYKVNINRTNNLNTFNEKNTRYKRTPKQRQL